MGQIIVSQTNERFETFVNDIVKQKIGKRLEFVFSSADSGKIIKTELIKVEWDKENNIVVSQASTDYGSTIDQLRTKKYKYVNGYFSDLVKDKGNYIAVTKQTTKISFLKAIETVKLQLKIKSCLMLIKKRFSWTIQIITLARPQNLFER